MPSLSANPSNAKQPPVPSRVRDNFFFPLLIACGGMFCLTALILVVCAFDTSGHPFVEFFEDYAAWMIYIEMGITVVVAILALTVDRLRTLSAMSTEKTVPSLDDGRVPALPSKDGN